MPRSPWCGVLVAIGVAVATAPAAQAKATASQRAEARRVYAPVAAFKRAIAPEAARLKSTMGAWQKAGQACIDQAQAELKDVTPAPDADMPAVVGVLLAAQVLDAEQEASKVVRAQLGAARRSYARMRLADRVLRRLARAEAHDIAFVLGLPDIDSCGFYRAWGQTGWSTAQMPPVIPGRDNAAPTAEEKAFDRAQKAGLKRLRAFGLPARRVKAVENFPFG
jgi:hypothetical protein